MTDVADSEEKKNSSGISRSSGEEFETSVPVRRDHVSGSDDNTSREANDISDVSENGLNENGSREILERRRGEPRVEDATRSSDSAAESDGDAGDAGRRRSLRSKTSNEIEKETPTHAEKDKLEAVVDMNIIEESQSHKTDFLAPDTKELDAAIDSKGEGSRLAEQMENENSKRNAGFGLASLCSIFKIIKANDGNINRETVRNNERRVRESNSAMSYQNNFINEGISCCLLGNAVDNRAVVQPSKLDRSNGLNNNILVVNISPKPQNGKVLPRVQLPNGIASQTHCETSLLDIPSSVAIGSVVSREESSSSSLSSATRSISSQIINAGFGSDAILESNNVPSAKDPHFLQCTQRSQWGNMAATTHQIKLKLIHEGDVLLSFPNHSKTIVSKVLSSKFLRRWESHHVYLNDDSISLKSPTGILESPVSYSNVQEVYAVGRADMCTQFCLRLVLAEGSVLLQANNAFIRDQWIYSILWKKSMHKYRNILLKCTRPEVVLKEMKSLIRFTLDSMLRDDRAASSPIDVIDKVLAQSDIWSDRERREKVIIALDPLANATTPSQEMFRFFSEHCLLHPRSPVINDVFTTVVHRILKRTLDFGKSPCMRKFAADYMTALYLQNDGEEAIRKFLQSLHGPNFECPHPRVLQNLVAVNLAAIFLHFEQKKILRAESDDDDDEKSSQAVQILNKQLECHITVFRVISEFEDWRPGVAQLLQPIPFPDDALTQKVFVEGLTPVIESIGTDPRCEVHELVLGIRESKGGWLNVFCPSSSVCDDSGRLWCRMLETLISCCCRRKGFLQGMMKHLGALILVALRGHDIAQEMLCLMLEWQLMSSEDQEMQIVTTLESTENGRAKYGELCKRQEHLRQLRRKRGPRKLTLPSRSTDVDVARLLSCGSFGNLECLSLAFTHVTSSCAHQLIQLPTLRYLNLWATHFGDAGLVVIAEHLDKLQVLNLCETPVTDKGITALAGMKNLKKLNLNSTKLSPQTLEILKQELPLLQELDVRYTDAW